MDLNEQLKLIEEAKTAELFAAKELIQIEIERRGWLILKQMGYDPYLRKSMLVELSKRGRVVTITISASFETNHDIVEIRHEFPLKQWEAILTEM